jgi:hypothetical protein
VRYPLILFPLLLLGAASQAQQLSTDTPVTYKSIAEIREGCKQSLPRVRESLAKVEPERQEEAAQVVKRYELWCQLIDYKMPESFERDMDRASALRKVACAKFEGKPGTLKESGDDAAVVKELNEIRTRMTETFRKWGAESQAVKTKLQQLAEQEQAERKAEVGERDEVTLSYDERNKVAKIAEKYKALREPLEEQGKDLGMKISRVIFDGDRVLPLCNY